MHTGPSNRSSVTNLAAILAAISVSSATACSVITDTNKDQCTITDDCIGKGAQFSGAQCVRGLCVLPVDSGVAAETGPAHECTNTANCLGNANTPNTYCSSDNQCLPIKTQDCTEIITVDGKAITPDAILMGVMAPLTGDNASDGAARVKAVTLAHQEFSGRAVGIPSGPGTPPRPIALVVCDQVADATRAATHLATRVGVPAIVGPGFSGTTVQVAMKVTVPSGVLLMSPSATTPDLTTLQDNGLVWRTSSSFAPEAKAYAYLLGQMESSSDLRAALKLASSDSIRVALLAKGDSYGRGLADLLGSTLRYNGTDVAGNGSANFARFDLPDLSANPSADTTAVLNGVRSFAPHIILVLGTAEVITKGMVPVEEQWMTGEGAPARPYYVFSEGAKLAQLVSAVGQSETSHADRKLKDRIRVFGPRYNEALYSSLQNRYSAAFNEAMPDTYGVTGSYDAFYLIAYAMLATQSSAAPTGASIAVGLGRTVAPGDLMLAGPSDISKAVAQLVTGKNIDYDGVTGPLDFDVSTGDSPGDYNLYCVRGDGYRSTSQYFLASKAQLVGNFGTCP